MSSRSAVTPSDLDRREAHLKRTTDVYVTQHSTSENHRIAVDGLILLTESGSTLHGTNLPDAPTDIDEMGICIEPPTHVIGLSPFEQYQYRDKPVNVRSEDGDVDRVVYGLRKWTSLIAEGNPTVCPILFAPVEKDRYVSPLGQSLLMSSHMFLSKLMGKRFLGYLQAQRSRYLDNERTDSTHASRPELIEKFGWDTKTGYHALRIAIQGVELMQEHTITLPMTIENREFLLGVRNGVNSKEQVTAMLDDFWIPRLQLATEQSTLPEKLDMNQLNAWLTKMYQRSWRDREDQQDHGGYL